MKLLFFILFLVFIPIATVFIWEAFVPLAVRIKASNYIVNVRNFLFKKKNKR